MVARFFAVSDSGGTISPFLRREPIKLTHSGALTDYQHYETFDYKATMLNNFNDIRFTTQSGEHIPYWIETKTDGVSAKVWFKNNYVDGDTYIWMYYGNNGLSSGSSRSDVMIDNVEFDYLAGDAEIDGSSDFYRAQQIVLSAGFIYDITFGAYSGGSGVEQIYHIVPDNSGKPSLVASSLGSKSLSSVPTGDYTIADVPIASTATYWLRSEIKSGDWANTYTLKGYTTSPYSGGARYYSSDDSSWTVQARDFEFKATQIRKYAAVEPTVIVGAEQHPRSGNMIL